MTVITHARRKSRLATMIDAAGGITVGVALARARANVAAHDLEGLRHGHGGAVRPFRRQRVAADMHADPAARDGMSGRVAFRDVERIAQRANQLGEPDAGPPQIAIRFRHCCATQQRAR